MDFKSALVMSSFAGLLLLNPVEGHGLLVDPPARNTIWREGFSNPVNYDDMGLNCGGFANQWDVNGGKCGVCGDPYQGPHKHEAGHPGGYANGVIGRTYKAGDSITLSAKITANHLGHIQYKICPVNDKSKKVTQQCLDKYPLADASGIDKFNIHDQIKSQPGVVKATVKLPAGLICSQCVIQWTYTTGNNDGDKQETFRNCADVQITIEGGDNPKPVSEGAKMESPEQAQGEQKAWTNCVVNPEHAEEVQGENWCNDLCLVKENIMFCSPEVCTCA